MSASEPPESNFGAFNMFVDAVDPAGEFADYYLRFGVGFADGRKATNLDYQRDLDEVPAPDPPTLWLVRWEGYDRLAWEVEVWAAGLRVPVAGRPEPSLGCGDRRQAGARGGRPGNRRLADGVSPAGPTLGDRRPATVRL